ncbi:MarR family winged helix-turn-helix transcriptional regulator [Actinomadura sp. NEAU-AAG7]|uniref:MarR family winged helix-turn-helix transcriptional regulator n=1 Tax=Actinomadura sp. NEAU-AAG7 TaxID=2839640 RepID=UPI001BE48E38|nr:MarR family transcriptional regulator [Actinomadura sp. NEAU-AAG7]MBT2206888.1 MarR family transcriptional regulator [Actinomadura sp. NEAU-AAG7]
MAEAVEPGVVVAALAKSVEHALLRVELTLPQYRMLSVLTVEEPPTASRVAWMLSVMPATVTAVMDGLVAGRYVRRERDPHDRRKVTLVITSEGRHLLATANEEINRRLGELASFLDAEQAERAMAALSLWHEALAGEKQAEWAAREGARRKESR